MSGYAVPDLVPVSGGYMRVFHQKNSIGVEYYDNDLKIEANARSTWSFRCGVAFMPDLTDIIW